MVVPHKEKPSKEVNLETSRALLRAQGLWAVRSYPHSESQSVCCFSPYHINCAPPAVKTLAAAYPLARLLLPIPSRGSSLHTVVAATVLLLHPLPSLRLLLSQHATAIGVLALCRTRRGESRAARCAPCSRREERLEAAGSSAAPALALPQSDVNTCSHCEQQPLAMRLFQDMLLLVRFGRKRRVEEAKRRCEEERLEGGGREALGHARRLQLAFIPGRSSSRAVPAADWDLPSLPDPYLSRMSEGGASTAQVLDQLRNLS